MPAKRGARKQKSGSSKEVAPLKSQNVIVCGRRTSMRLEPTMWEAFEDISRREGLSINDLCTRIKLRVDEQARRKGIEPDESNVTLTSAVRVFIAAYFRRASTDEGHSRAGHGLGDPFAGTPFEEATEPDADSSAGGGGSSGEGPNPTGRGMSSKPCDLHAEL